jgi:hypothetical protein
MLRPNLEKCTVLIRASAVPTWLRSLRCAIRLMTPWLARIPAALAAVCLLGCSDQSDPTPDTLASSRPSDATESKSPPWLPNGEAPSSATTAVPNGSGGLPPGFMCDGIAPDACEDSLRQGFGVTQTPLVLSASGCVPASAVEPSLDDSPVCHCEFTSGNYFSDTGGSSSSAYTIGLARTHATPSGSGDGCELWFQNSPETGICLLESSAFAGCSLDNAASSCQSPCQMLATNRAQAVATQMRTVAVVGVSCVQCNSGYCLGVLQVGTRCFLGMQYSLGYGYHPEPIACDASAEEQLQQSGYLRECALQTDGGAEPSPPPAGDQDHAGLPGDAGARPASQQSE